VLNPDPLKVIDGAANIRISLPSQGSSAQVDLLISFDISRISVNVCSGFFEHLYS
jgi:hypothetical protein